MLVLVTAVAAMTLPAALATPTGAAGPKKAKPDLNAVLRQGAALTTVQGGSPFDLDPAKADYLHMPWLRPLYDTLLHQAADGSLEPGLASVWKIVDDQTVDLTLRKGVKFQDGEPLTGDAVKQSFEHKQANPLGRDATAWQKLESVEATGDLAVRVHLKAPVAGAFLDVIASTPQGMVVSPKALATGDVSAHPVGAGPYKFESYEKEQRLVLRKFDGYWNAKAYKFAGLEFVNTPAGDPNVGLNMMFADTVDLLTLAQAQVEAVEARPGFSVTVRPSMDNLFYVTVCHTTAPFNKPKVRQALQFALDRKALSDFLTGGTGTVAYMAWPKGSQFYFPDIAKRWRYDPKRARQLLDQAGVPKHFQFDMISPIGVGLERLAEVVKDQLQKVGLDANLIQSNNIPVDLYMNNKAPVFVSLSPFTGVERLVQRFSPTSLGNWCHYNDPRLNAVIEKIAAGPKTQDEARQLWKQAEEMVADFGAPIYLFFSSLYAAHTDKLVGLNHIYPLGEGFDLEGVSLTK